MGVFFGFGPPCDDIKESCGDDPKKMVKVVMMISMMRCNLWRKWERGRTWCWPVDLERGRKGRVWADQLGARSLLSPGTGGLSSSHTLRHHQHSLREKSAWIFGTILVELYTKYCWILDISTGGCSTWLNTADGSGNLSSAVLGPVNTLLVWNQNVHQPSVIFQLWDFIHRS